MRMALAASLLLLTTAATNAQTTPTLDGVFADYCATDGSASPICHGDPSATDGYKWLLVADVCDHDGERGHESPPPRRPYCVSFGRIRSETEPCVVAYSHRRGRWRPLHTLEASGKWAYDTDVNGVPSIVVSRTSACTAIVEDTRPLIYAVQLGEVKEEENDLFAGLKELTGLLGDTLASVAEHALAAQSSPFDELTGATSALAASLNSVGDLRADIVAALNAVESSERGALTPVDWTASLDAAEWHRRFARARTARREAFASLQGATPDKHQQALLDASQKLLDRREDATKLVAALSATHDRWNQYVIDSRMMTWMVVNLRAQPVSWTKDQVHAFKVAVETPFASDVATRLQKVDTSVRFTSPKASMFGVGAGLIVTPIRQATYKAVPDAAGVKRITATEHDSRTGQLALFFDWRFVQAWHPAASTWITRPALEGGVAIDTKTPGFFLGLSMEVTKWIRVSYGRTWQNVKVLDGQMENDTVANDDAIKLKDTFVDDRYFSVSFAIDALPLFTSK